MPSTVLSFIPRFRIVSIIPGIESLAPERTETKSGFSLSPNFLPVCFSTSAKAAFTSSITPSGILLPELIYSMQVSVVIVKPGGTGSPAFVISARFAPFPPSKLRISALPSLKSHTRFCVVINFFSFSMYMKL